MTELEHRHTRRIWCLNFLKISLKNQYSNSWRRVNCSKFICSKKLLDTKISTARHHSSR